MKKYILFENDILIARYDEAIHGENIPSGAIEVSEELFFQTINENDGVWSLVDGEIVKLPLPEQPPVIPTTVTMAQARLALLHAGKLQAVDDAVDALEGEAGVVARIEWEYRGTVDRNSPLVASLAAALELSEQSLDELFSLAATL